MNLNHQGIGMTSQRTRERLVQRLRERGVGHGKVLEVMGRIPRHIFVDEALASRAYEDTALPIGNGQTISQPFTVARMSEILMAVQPRRVLEVGTGCGYQSAVLAELVDEVYSVERIAVLSQKARDHLRELGIHNVRLRVGDGFEGWAANGPYDGILVAAAPAEVPEALLGQLADGGRLVIPIGGRDGQRLHVLTREGNTIYQEESDLVSFVPMLTGIRR